MTDDRTMFQKLSYAIRVADDLERNGADYYDHLARAALQAIREPSREMVLAGDRARYSIPATFTAMIDSILNEGDR